jgi:hypothetical protein
MRTMKIFKQFILILFCLLPGCGDEDGNNTIFVHNQTDKQIRIDYSEVIDSDLDISRPNFAILNPNESVQIEVEDRGLDGEIEVTYDGKTRIYDLDPYLLLDQDSIDIRTEDFSTL